MIVTGQSIREGDGNISGLGSQLAVARSDQ